MPVLAVLGLLVVSLVIGDGVGATFADMISQAEGPVEVAGAPTPADEKVREVNDVAG